MRMTPLPGILTVKRSLLEFAENFEVNSPTLKVDAQRAQGL
jgi:hypothetical protein